MSVNGIGERVPSQYEYPSQKVDFGQKRPRLSTDQRSGMARRYKRATSCRKKIISGKRRRLFRCACDVWRSIGDNKPLTQKIRRTDHAQRMPTASDSAWGDLPAAPLRRKNVLGWPARVFGDIFFPIYVGDKF